MVKLFFIFLHRFLLTHFYRKLKIIPGAISKIVRTTDLTIYGIILEYLILGIYRLFWTAMLSINDRDHILSLEFSAVTDK